MPRRRPETLPAALLPDDLAPLPVFVGDNAYAANPIDKDQARSAIWHAAGNVTKAARLLEIAPARLMNFVRKDPYLTEERARAAELLIDQAEDVLLDLLDDDDRREETAKWILDRRGAQRGWGSSVRTPAQTSISFGGSASGALAIRWQTDEE